MSSQQSQGQRSRRLQAVTVDALVVMKIVKHARENPGQPVEGPLLGLVQDATLEVTNCFPLPSRRDADDDSHDYQKAMMAELRDLNVDNMQVGYYRVSDMGTYYHGDVVETLLQWQRMIKEAVLLVYDPAQIAQGALAIKALRLTDRAMNLLSEEGTTVDAIKKARVTSQSIFMEVPVTLRMTSLAKAIIPDLTSQVPQEDVFDRLDLTTHSFMEKNVRLLLNCVTSLNDDTNKFQAYQRAMDRYKREVETARTNRQLENEQRIAKGMKPLPEDDVEAGIKVPSQPSRLEALLATAQISTYCKQMARFGSQSYGKLYLAQAIQPNEK